MKKYIFIMKKKRKKNLVQKFGDLLLPNLYCKEGNCIAIQFVSLGLYCRM